MLDELGRQARLLGPKLRELGGEHGEGPVAEVEQVPGDERCRRDGASLSIGLVIEAPGTYEAIRLSSRAALPPPQPTGLEVDVVTARESGASVASEPPVTVR